MKAIWPLNNRGTIHDWRHSDGGYFVPKCSHQNIPMVPEEQLRTKAADLKGMPLCKKCFPERNS